jgi:hypothetical protein
VTRPITASFWLITTNHRTDQEGLGDGLQQFDEGIGRHHVAQAAQRIELAEIGGERLGAEVPATDQHRRRQHHEHDGARQRQAGQQHAADVGGDPLDEHVRVVDLLAVERQAAFQHGRQLVDEAATHHPQAGAGGHQDGKGGDFARAGNIALFARLPQSFL